MIPVTNSEDFQFHILKELRQLRSEVTELRKALLTKESTNLEVAKVASNQVNIEIRITNILRDMGIPANLKGYRFLREAIKLVYQDSDNYGQVTKTLYPEVAKTFSETPSKVERAIRHAIEIVHYKKSKQNPKSFRRQSNSEVIFNIADELKLQDANFIEKN